MLSNEIALLIAVWMFFVLCFLGAVVWLLLRTRQRKSVCSSSPSPHSKNDSAATRPPSSAPAVMPPPRLQSVEGIEAGKEFPLSKPLNTIGRAPDNSIVIEGILVSRNHAQIERRGDQFWLVDLGSTNGTYVNGTRIAEYQLQRGDSIRIGKAVLVFQSGPAIAPVQRVQVEPISVPTRVPSERDGTRGLGAYQLAETIGVGGAATVYKAYMRANHAPVAIKILHSRDPFVRQRFEIEAKIVEQLDHPHIVKVLAHDENNYFIVMEYVDGGSLRQRLVPGKAAALDFLQVVIGQTCEALAYAHQRGVVHRDIKPENIMLATQGGIKVVDFGIAKLATVTTQTVEGTLIGTPYYIPPELVVGDEAVPASDIYSLGVVLYEMLTGQWPFTGTTMEVLQKHRYQAPIPPRQLNPAIPPTMEQVALRALQKDIHRRYQNAMDLARDLGYLPGMSLQVLPISNLTTIPPNPLGQARIPSPNPLPSPGRAINPRLIIVAGARPGREIPCSQGQTVFARETIDPKDISISREHHFRVTWEGSQFWIEDAGSTNGTFVNDVRITSRMPLRPGDKIRAGQTRMQFAV